MRAQEAVGTGRILDSPAINAAGAAAGQTGGGQLFGPAGNNLTGSIRLQSNIALYLEQGTTLIATSDKPVPAYDPAEPR